jgi:uncharacterized protein (DUF58 family)
MKNATKQTLQKIHARALQASELFPFDFDAIKTTARHGNILNKTLGNSLDFAQHREYQSGDDLKSIDWRAYARTELLSVKLYEREVTPSLDIVLDCSSSMLMLEPKRTFAFYLLYYLLESCRLQHGSTEIYLWDHTSITPCSATRILEYDITFVGEQKAVRPETMEQAQFRPLSTRLCISDLLYECDPAIVIRPLTYMSAHTALLVPYTQEERSPTWQGRCELEDIETRKVTELQVTTQTLQYYREAYQTHFGLWSDTAKQFGAAMTMLLAEEEPKAPNFLMK